MLTSTQYINANKDAAVENALLNYIRYQYNINISIHGSAEHATRYNICTYDEALTAYTTHLHDVLKNYNAFHSFLNRRRKITTIPATRTAQQYIFIIWECDLTIDAAYKLLKQAAEA